MRHTFYSTLFYSEPALDMISVVLCHLSESAVRRQCTAEMGSKWARLFGALSVSGKCKLSQSCSTVWGGGATRGMGLKKKLGAHSVHCLSAHLHNMSGKEPNNYLLFQHYKVSVILLFFFFFQWHLIT